MRWLWRTFVKTNAKSCEKLKRPKKITIGRLTKRNYDTTLLNLYQNHACHCCKCSTPCLQSISSHRYNITPWKSWLKYKFLHRNYTLCIHVKFESNNGKDRYKISNTYSPLESIWTTPCRPVRGSEMEQILTRMKELKGNKIMFLVVRCTIIEYGLISDLSV